MKNTPTLLISFLISIGQTCAAQDAPKVTAQEYESCCGTQPVEFSYEKKRIYVPNVFTPNKDGVNDYFFPVVNDVVTDIWGFAVYILREIRCYIKSPISILKCLYRNTVGMD